MPKYRSGTLSVRGFSKTKERQQLWERFCRWSRMQGHDTVADGLAKAITSAMEGWNGLPLRPEEKKLESAEA